MAITMSFRTALPEAALESVLQDCGLSSHQLSYSSGSATRPVARVRVAFLKEQDRDNFREALRPLDPNAVSLSHAADRRRRAMALLSLD